MMLSTVDSNFFARGGDGDDCRATAIDWLKSSAKTSADAPMAGILFFVSMIFMCVVGKACDARERGRRYNQTA